MKPLLTKFAGMVLFSVVLAMPSLVLADPEASHPRTISVSGEAIEEVAPDQAVLSVSLMTKDKNLAVAKQANDAMADRLVVIARDYKIPKEKMGMSGVYISPEYNYNSSSAQQTFSDYVVNRRLSITMDDVTKEELFLSAIVEAQIEQVNGIEFRLADREEHAAPLRTKAYENAKAKAMLLAQAAGVKLGQPITITLGDITTLQPRPMPVRNMAMSAAVSSVAPTLPGQIELQETVQVTFGME